jgi:uncharacterized protein (TIGR03437 family)
MPRPLVKALQAVGLLVSMLPLSAQKPVINPNGILNAASFQPWGQPGHLLAPGSIASIFGQNLATETAVATSVPLPTSLGGTSVIVNGLLAPLFFVSPGQINFQVPHSGSGSGQPGQTVFVTTPAGTSDPVTTDQPYGATLSNFALFTLDGSGCGHGAILNVSPDGSASVNSPSNSAAPGSYLALFGTGLGPYASLPPDGAPTPDSPPFPCCYGGGYFDRIYIGGEYMYGLFAGRAPGLTGVDQVNLMVPKDAQQGCSVSLQAGVHPVAVSIHAGGGQCVDPSNTHSKAEMLLVKSVVLNAPTLPESDNFFASFTKSPYDFACGISSPSLCPYSAAVNTLLYPSDWLARDVSTPPPCTTPGYTKLDAGTLVVTASGTPLASVKPSLIGRALGYEASLPAGSIKPGDVAISTSAGNEVGPFATGFRVGTEIRITSTFPQGTVLRGAGPPSQVSPVVIKWNGGEPGDIVTVSALQHDLLYAEGDAAVVVAQTPATAGSVTIGPTCLFENSYCTMPWSQPSKSLDLIVSVGPDAATLPKFQAPGLTLGGLAGWAYEYRFIGLVP